MEAEPSRTAMLVATARALHRQRDEHPWIFDDPFATVLLGPAWPELQALADALFPEHLQRGVRGGATARSRYAEERLFGGGFTQYVLLGAGLDSLAWRRPDVLRRLTIFEVDHPASQAWKRERVARAALPANERHVFVPIDFEVESLRTGLDAAGFDWTQPTMFSWLGVTMYLTTEAIETTLRTIATCVPGSEVVFTYRVDEIADAAGLEFLAVFEPLASQYGEPLQPGYSAKEIEALVTRCGLRIEDLPSWEQLVARYFAGRADGLVPWSPECLVVAAVP